MRVGFTKAYRKELDSDIWKMPPLYQRVFFYLRQEAVWQPETFPTRKGYGIALNPGQLITSFSTIADGVSWYEYGVKKIPNKKMIKSILEWLESNSMVTVFSNRHGTFIMLINWDVYNGIEIEKVTPNNQTKVTPEKRSTDTLKEGKEPKEEKNNIYTPIFNFWNSQKIIQHRKLDDKTKTAIRSALKIYEEVEINEAIKNYSIVFKSDQYFFNYKWPLIDFLIRGLKNFVVEADPLQNYLKNKQAIQPAITKQYINMEKD